jgi:Domain of unknown function (DUF4123)
MGSIADTPAGAWRKLWITASSADTMLRLFALVDAAQDKRVVPMIVSEAADNECLFGYGLDSPIAKATPRLVSLSAADASRLQAWLLASMCDRPIATLVASTLDLPTLAAHFRRCIDVELQDLGSMYLAVWDPAILGTLLGQPDDSTLHMPGPVLKPEQIRGLVSPLNHWWYVDRDGGWHDAIQPAWRAKVHRAPSNRLVLDADQVDQLVEASVPDHLLQHIRQNQPELLERLAPSQHYRYTQQQLHRARAHGLVGTGDLVNYVCLALAFGSAFDELPAMAALLVQVKAGAMTFDDALNKVPEAELTAHTEAPVLL